MVLGHYCSGRGNATENQDSCQKCKFFVVPQKFAGDCGSQIAWQGLLEASVKKGASLEDTFVKQSWRLDTVEVTY